SWSDYMFRARRDAVNRLRRQIAQQVTTLERDIQAHDDQRRLRLDVLLDAALRRSEGGLAWIQIRAVQGTVLAHAGDSPDLRFPLASIEAGFQHRHPVFKVTA